MPNLNMPVDADYVKVIAKAYEEYKEEVNNRWLGGWLSSTSDRSSDIAQIKELMNDALRTQATKQSLKDNIVNHLNNDMNTGPTAFLTSYKLFQTGSSELKNKIVSALDAEEARLASEPVALAAQNAKPSSAKAELRRALFGNSPEANSLDDKRYQNEGIRQAHRHGMKR